MNKDTIIKTQKLIDENYRLKLKLASKDDQYQKLMNDYELVLKENQELNSALYDVCVIANDFRKELH